MDFKTDDWSEMDQFVCRIIIHGGERVGYSKLLSFAKSLAAAAVFVPTKVKYELKSYAIFFGSFTYTSDSFPLPGMSLLIVFQSDPGFFLHFCSSLSEYVFTVSLSFALIFLRYILYSYSNH